MIIAFPLTKSNLEDNYKDENGYKIRLIKIFQSCRNHLRTVDDWSGEFGHQVAIKLEQMITPLTRSCDLPPKTIGCAIWPYSVDIRLLKKN